MLNNAPDNLLKLHSWTNGDWFPIIFVHKNYIYAIYYMTERIHIYRKQLKPLRRDNRNLSSKPSICDRTKIFIWSSLNIINQSNMSKAIEEMKETLTSDFQCKKFTSQILTIANLSASLIQCMCYKYWLNMWHLWAFCMSLHT